MQYNQYMNQYGRLSSTVPYPVYGHMQTGGTFPGLGPYTPHPGPTGSLPVHMDPYQGPSYMPPVYVQDQIGKHSQLFINPLQTKEDMYTPFQQGAYANPYPLPVNTPLPPKPTNGHLGTILNSFKSQSGSFDFNKMVDTAGQMVNALTQVSNMAKGLSGLFKG